MGAILPQVRNKRSHLGGRMVALGFRRFTLPADIFSSPIDRWTILLEATPRFQWPVPLPPRFG